MGQREPRSVTVGGVFERFAAGASGDIPSWAGVWTRRRYVDPELVVFHAPDPMFDGKPDRFEWEDLLVAVMLARESFTMIELGAGWGRWTVNAAAACRRWDGGLRHRLVAVEGEPTHARWTREHCRANGVRRRSREGTCRVIRAAVSDRAGFARFAVGNPSGWYGQALDDDTWSPERTRLVRTIRLSSLLRRLGRVDFIHADIQGAELPVFREAAEELHRVARLHIATHGDHVEVALRELFSSLGLECVRDYPAGSTLDPTDGPPIHLGDGVQSWVAPSMAA